MLTEIVMACELDPELVEAGDRWRRFDSGAAHWKDVYGCQSKLSVDMWNDDMTVISTDHAWLHDSTPADMDWIREITGLPDRLDEAIESHIMLSKRLAYRIRGDVCYYPQSFDLEPALGLGQRIVCVNPTRGQVRMLLRLGAGDLETNRMTTND